jgi:hypothetical protein
VGRVGVSLPPDRGPLVERLEGTLTADRIERIADVCGARTPLEFQIAGVPETSFGAQGRLLGFLALRLLAGSQPLVRLPDRRGPDSLAADTGSARFVTQDLAGFLLARLASDVVDRDGESVLRDVHELQRQFVKQNDGFLQGFQLWAYPLVDSYPGVPVSRFADTLSHPRTEDFRQAIEAELRTLGLELPSDDDVSALMQVLVEALDNTTRHGTLRHDGSAIAGVRVVSVTRRRFRDLDESGLDAQSSASFGAYVDLLSEQKGSAYLQNKMLVEFMVADCGVGIPAAKAGSTHVYAGPHADELEWLDRAFHTSEDRPGHTWDGMGLLKIQSAVRDLNGFLSVRTGRTLATRHHLGPARDRDVMAVDPDDRPRALLGGTCLSVFVPWVSNEPSLFDAE